MITILFGLLFLILPFIFLPVTSELFEFNKIICLYVFTILIVGTWLIKCIQSKRIIFTKTILDIPLLLFLSSQIISTIFSIDQTTSLFGYYGRFNGGLFSTICYILLYWAFVSNISSKYILQLIKVILFSGLLVSFWVILEKYGYSIGCLILTGQFNVACWAQDASDRVFASLGQPNWLAAWLVAIIPFTWMVLLNTKNKKIIFHILTLMMFISLLFTKSRSGIFGFIGTFACFWGLIIKTTKYKFLFTFIFISTYLAITAAILGTPWTQPIFKSDSNTVRLNDTAEIRLIVWKGAVDIWAHNPLIGTGVETFAHAYYRYRPIEHNFTSEWDFVYNKAHNEFLNYAANTGLLGIFSYFFIIITFIYWSLKNSKSLYTITFLAAFIGLNITSFFGFLTVNTSLLFFIIPAMAISLTSTNRPLKHKVIKFHGSKILIILTLIFMSFLLFNITKIWMADVYFAKGRENNNNFNFQEGNNNIQKAIFLAPYFANYHDEIAQSLVGLGEIDSAISHINTAQNLSPKSVTLAKSRASLYTQIFQIKPQYKNDAIYTFLKLSSDTPTDPQIFYMLGLVYASQGDSDNAIKVFEKALILKPDFEKVVEALTLLGYNSPYDSKNR